MNRIRIFISSVQVMLFSDRLEVLNPGRLPPSLTLEQLRETHRSVPSNPLLARSLYLNRYIEEMGIGTLDMIRRCSPVGWVERNRERRSQHPKYFSTTTEDIKRH